MLFESWQNLRHFVSLLSFECGQTRKGYSIWMGQSAIADVRIRTEFLFSKYHKSQLRTGQTHNQTRFISTSTSVLSSNYRFFFFFLPFFFVVVPLCAVTVACCCCCVSTSTCGEWVSLETDVALGSETCSETEAENEGTVRFTRGACGNNGCLSPDDNKPSTALDSNFTLAFGSALANELHFALDSTFTLVLALVVLVVEIVVETRSLTSWLTFFSMAATCAVAPVCGTCAVVLVCVCVCESQGGRPPSDSTGLAKRASNNVALVEQRTEDRGDSHCVCSEIVCNNRHVLAGMSEMTYSQRMKHNNTNKFALWLQHCVKKPSTICSPASSRTCHATSRLALYLHMHV